MEVKFLEIKGDWREVADSARTTINLEEGKGEPFSSWKRKMVLSEHSPIRQILVRAKWVNLPYWVSTHLVRHKIGVEHWVRSQRSDRTGEDRSNKSQDAVVEHEILASAQAIISISRKRLCKQASTETRKAWIGLLEKLSLKEPELAGACVPDCVYRGCCLEYRSCGVHKEYDFADMLSSYRDRSSDTFLFLFKEFRP